MQFYCLSWVNAIFVTVNFNSFDACVSLLFFLYRHGLYCLLWAIVVIVNINIFNLDRIQYRGAHSNFNCFILLFVFFCYYWIFLLVHIYFFTFINIFDIAVNLTIRCFLFGGALIFMLIIINNPILLSQIIFEYFMCFSCRWLKWIFLRLLFILGIET